MEVLELALPADRSLGGGSHALLEPRRGGLSRCLVPELSRCLVLELSRCLVL